MVSELKRRAQAFTRPRSLRRAWRMESVSVSAEWCTARSPACGATISPIEPESSAATGTPSAMASTVARPNGSAHSGVERYTSPVASMSGSVEWSRWPW